MINFIVKWRRKRVTCLHSLHGGLYSGVRENVTERNLSRYKLTSVTSAASYLLLKLELKR